MNESHGERLDTARERGLVLYAIFVVAGIVFAVWFATQITDVLSLLAVSVALSVGLNPLVKRIASARLPIVKRRLPRAGAILLIYLVLVVFVAAVGIAVIPRLVIETRNLIGHAPEYLDRLQQYLRGFEGSALIPDLESLEGQLARQVTGSLSQVLDILLVAANFVFGIASAAVILMLTFFLLMEGGGIFDHFLSLLAPSQRDDARVLGAKMAEKVEGWLKGVFLLSLFIGVGTTAGMWLIGMPYPLLLGVIAGIFEMVPMVGAVLGATPAVIVALFQPTWQLIATIVFFIVLQQIENNILAPGVMERQLKISPLLTVVALLIGASLAGLVGALLAVPTAAILQVVWTDVVAPRIRERHGVGTEPTP